MKFKSEEEEKKETNNVETECGCPLCKSLEVVNSQIDIVMSMLSAIKINLENIEKLHEKHNSE